MIWRSRTADTALDDSRAKSAGVREVLAIGSWLFFPPWSPGSSLLGSDLGEHIAW